MEFKFDANQDFQIDAIEAVTDLFEGQGCVPALVEFQEGTLNLAAIANHLSIEETKILENLQAIQKRNRISPDVEIDTGKLLEETVPEIEMAEVAPPRVTITKSQVQVSDSGIFEALQMSAAKTAVYLAGRYPLPNLVEVMSNLMEHTSPPVRLTRRTLLEVFRRLSNKSKKVAMDNPGEWAASATRILKEKLSDHLVNGIKYEKIGQCFEMRQIEEKEILELFSKYSEPSKDKAIYDLIPCDSEVERQFVKDLEARKDVKLYFKLPYWFVVPTPVGDYRPDWAIVMENSSEGGKPRLYFVAETKGSSDKGALRSNEWMKIRCGEAHFGSEKKKGALDGVEYKVVRSASELP